MTADELPLYDLSDRYHELQERARALAAAVSDVANEADESDSVHTVVRERLAASGLAAATVPGAYGGLFTQVDPLAVTIIREALAGVSAHLDSLFGMQGIGSYPLTVGGTDAVRRRWLPAVAACQAIPALALTEPDVGSDLRAITSTVRTESDGLIVAGHKSFITNAGDADIYCMLCRDGDGYTMVLVPADAPGVKVTRPHQIIAPHVLGDVILDDVRVPLDHRIGQPGQGFKLALATLATFRVSVAGAAVGLGQAALDEAVRHTTGREQFGVPLARLGPVPVLLARSWADIEAARSLAYRAAAAAARDPLGSLQLSSMAKVVATETCGQVVDRCVQVMGRFGLVRGSVIERLYRAARPMRIYEGSTEVILDALARQLVRKQGRAEA